MQAGNAPGWCTFQTTDGHGLAPIKIKFFIAAFRSEAEFFYTPLVPRLCLGTHRTFGSAIDVFRFEADIFYAKCF